jgi:signal transduction histidine kinase
MLIIHQGDPLQKSLQPAAAERFHAWFKADMGIQRVYPWILLGPYVALLALYFPLERGRLRLSLPLNIAACAAFVAASHEINTRTSVAEGNVTIITRQFGAGPLPGSHETDQFFKSAPANLPQPQLAENQSLPNPPDHDFLGIVIRGHQDFSEAGMTNLLAELPRGVKPPFPPPGQPRISLFSILLDLLAYGAILGVAHSVHFYRRFRERERRALFLESNLANSRLDALRAQLHPHFLFNSLNAVATLVRRDPRLAEATLISLSELLRLALSQSERQEVPLREEMQFVQRYLEIQQTRFGDKLRVEQEIEPASLDCLVPTLLLQPLVENAIRHGIEPAENAGLVRLTARRQNGLLVLTVEDDGVGLPAADSGKLDSTLKAPSIASHELQHPKGVAAISPG